MPTYLSEWNWDDPPGRTPCWRAPGDAAELRDSLDLRSLPQAGAAGFTTSSSGFGLFTYNRTQSGMALELPVRPETNLSNTQKSGLKSLLGLAQDYVVPDRWGDALFEILTVQSDPTGENRWKPLRPNPQRELALRHDGRMFRSERFDPKSPAGVKVREVFQHDYRQHMALIESLPAADADQEFEALGRYLGAAMGRYRLPKAMLLPAEYANHPAREPHTTITDDFNRANNNFLNPAAEGWGWGELHGDWRVFSNAAEDFGGVSTVYANSALSTEDHYAQVTVLQIDGTATGTQTCGGPLCRKDANSTMTFYQAQLWGNTSLAEILHWENNTATVIGTSSNVSVSLPQAFKIEAIGDDIKVYWNGVEVAAAVDTAISGKLYTGMRNDDQGTPTAQCRFDDFIAEDIVADGGGISIPVVQQHRRLMGVI